MPAGTKPYPCGHPGCDWSFALKHQLKAHEKTHDRESSGICPPSNRNHSDLYALATRYTCSHPAHDDTFPAFPTWSALQAHLHTAHPPTCPHPECSGRTFKSTQRLREHLQVHEDREADIRSRKEQSPGDVQEGEGEADLLPGLLLDGVSKRKKRRRSSVWVEAEGAKSPKLPRLLDGEAGKEWACGDEGCEKRFKTVSAYPELNHHLSIFLGTALKYDSEIRARNT
jgi:general transcription factor IIIA